MKILFVSQRYGSEIIGGSEYATRQFAERLVPRGHDVTVVTSCATSYVDWGNVFTAGTAETRGVTVVRFPVKAMRDQEVFGELHDKVLRRAPMFHFEQKLWAARIGPELVGFPMWMAKNTRSFDVVVFKSYLYYPTTHGIPLVAGRTPIVFHAEAHPEEMLDLPLYEGVFRLADAFQFGTPEERELIRLRFGFEPNGETVGVGIDEPESLDESVLDDRLRAIVSSPYVLVLGRLGGGKGTNQLVGHFARYSAERDGDLRLVFAGEEPTSWAGGKNIAFAGYLTEHQKQVLLSGAVCLIQPSLLESFSIVLIEAWNVGTPVLADGRCGVVAGQIARSSGGLTYGSYGEFKVGLDALRMADVRNRFGAAGRRFVEANYRWPQVLTRFESVVQTAIHRFASRGA
jgi:glycosyltransferase involved in cell wall biosynthesis